eukprot:gnl/Chilomastix_cuspidata/2658.p1 GENE.gnl/Chilomastix_cuspidata/2658~~gnl/Chilomastix_cuspidata/2658.p1  ORF type:complete len:290 (-),score=73.25 gnl/Chilomastix_cuspidata/2658:97-966(-)
MKSSRSIEPIITCTKRGEYESRETVTRKVQNACFNDSLPTSHQFLSCIDGRHSGPILGTPGGDFGEFLLGLIALSHVKPDSITLNYKQIEKLLFDFVLHEIPKARSFYWHTDDRAVHQFQVQTSCADPLAAANHGVAGALDALATPPCIGCGHVKKMMTFPSTYMTYGELVGNAIRAFYSLVWTRAEFRQRVEYVVLHGDHAETAIVVASASGKERQPMVTPACEIGSVFVSSPTAAAAFRDVVCQYFARIGRANPRSLSARIAALASIHSSVTTYLLCPTLPVFTAAF